MVIGGAGLVGTAVTRAMRILGFARVLPVDLHPTEEVQDPAKARAILGEVDMVVVLTRAGGDFEEYVEHLAPGTIVLDDTHPSIGGQLRRRIVDRGCHFYKLAARLENSFMWPPLPGFGGDEPGTPRSWPGCAVEAWVTLAQGRRGLTIDDQEEFDRAAASAGFEPHLSPHRA
jgi:hypothetical protein